MHTGRLYVFLLAFPPIEDRLTADATYLLICLFIRQFVAHPNCQQHLTSIWFGPETGFMQSLPLWKKLIMWLVCVPLLPFFCLIYIISPNNKVRTRTLPAAGTTTKPRVENGDGKRDTLKHEN